MGVKEKISGTTSSIKDQLGYLKKDSVFIKKILETKNIIFLKTDATAILVRRKGNEQEFFKEFDNITKEGYKMMLSEEITDPVPGIKVILGYVYFFQNKKFIN